MGYLCGVKNRGVEQLAARWAQSNILYNQRTNGYKT
jgi:hypothetical protein